MLRADLKILARPETGGCVLIDEKTGKEYEFGEVEHWLIQRLLEGKTVEALCLECNVRFSLHYRVEDIGEFLAMLSEWGLIAEACACVSVPQVDLETDGVERPPAARLEEDCNQSRSSADSSGSPRFSGEKDDAILTPVDASAVAGLRQSGHWHLFNPQGLFGRLADAFHPLRFLVWLTPLMFVVGAACVIARPDVFFTDLGRAYARFNLIGRMLFAALSVNLVSQVARGIVARRFGIDTPSFGVMLAFGLIPRFNIQLSVKGQPDRRTRLWLNATSTLVRLWLFALGAVTWALLRQGGSNLAVAGIELALISIVGLFFVANPLWNGDGSRFFSALLTFPDLHRQSRSALQAFFVKVPVVVARHRRYSVALGLFGLASVALVSAFAAFIAYRSFTYLELNHRGAGVVLFLLLGGYVSLKLRRVSGANEAAGDARRPPLGSRKPHGLHFAGLIILVICALWPYRYETGGDVEVLPLARATISPEMDGVIENVFVSSGQSVKAGDVLAQMADYRYLNEIRIIEADIEAKQNEIRRYQTTPSTAEIKLAEERLTTARVQLSYTEGKLARQKTLMERGFISEQAYEDIRGDLDRDRQQLNEAIRSLEAVKVLINPYQIAQSRDELQKLQRQTDYYREQLRRTRLISPVGGRVVTSDIQYQRNSYLEAGKVFVEIEDTGSVFVRIAVPEFDIGDVVPGAAVQVKFWAFPRLEFEGVVEEIEPATSEASYGRIIYVKCRLSNEHTLLKSGLTGFAKIQGTETVLILAFTRALVRFVVIEVWSWLP